MTISELKELIANLPDRDEAGEDYEVWMLTGRNLSSPVLDMVPLNRGDVLFTCAQWEDLE